MTYIVFIILGVLWIMISTLVHYGRHKRIVAHKFLVHGTALEFIWTVLPAVVLVLIAFPSFKLLYLMDEIIEPSVTIKAIGHQWYWSYEYSDYALQDGSTINFDSYMVPEDELTEGQFRLLEVDNSVKLPVNTHVRVVITAADVLHCWTVPSLGVKADAVPGRLNQVGFLAYREGLFYGQCSEICGANHSKMPIVVEIVNVEDYCLWIDELLAEERG
jgi:cytochrome c oxidase subunit 2